MNKREIFTLSALTFSVGVALGFLLSPISNGIGNNSGNTTTNYYGKEGPTDKES